MPATAPLTVAQLLKTLVTHNGDALVCRVGSQPRLMREGRVGNIKAAELKPTDTQNLAESIAPPFLSGQTKQRNFKVAFEYEGCSIHITVTKPADHYQLRFVRTR